MATAPFDTLRIAQALRDAGFDEKQSEAIVSAIQDSQGRIAENLVTKSDLFAVESRLETKILELRADMYRALWMQGGALVMIMVALFTLFRLLE